jgi:hypothetical protein
METARLKLADGFGREASAVSQVVKEDENIVTAGQDEDTDADGRSDGDNNVYPGFALLTVVWGRSQRRRRNRPKNPQLFYCQRHHQSYPTAGQ